MERPGLSEFLPDHGTDEPLDVSVLNTGGTLSGSTVDLVGRNGASTVTNQAITRFQITEQRFFREKWDCPDVACVGPHSNHDFVGDVDFSSFTETGRTTLESVSAGIRAGLDGANIVVDNLAISGDTLSNAGGTIDVTNTMDVTTRGDITNTSGNIRGGDVNLTSTDGSIVNQTAVTRFGDNEEFQDQAGRTGTITARQDLSLDAKADILNRGGNIDAGGDATLKAGGDIRSQALALESRTKDYSLDGNLIERTETTTITEETTHQKAGISVGGNLDAAAGNTFALVGSDTNVVGNANIEARDIDIRKVTDSKTVTTEESQRGFNTDAGLEEGKDTQYRAGVSYDTRDTTTSTTDTTVVGAGLKVGGDLGLKGTNSITVTGSDVESGGDMNIETRRLLTQAAEQGTQTLSSEATTSIGVYATGGGDRAGWGIQGDIGQTDSQSWDMKARGSTLKSGGNITRNVEGGTITDIGTQIEAGGDFTQTADTIESLAAEDRNGSTTSSTTTSMNWETGARYEGEQAYDDAVEGSSASINPRLEQSMKTTTTMTDTSESSSRAVVSRIRAGGNVNSTSTGKTTLEGTTIDAGKDVNLNAGDLEFKAAADTYFKTGNVEVIGTEV